VAGTAEPFYGPEAFQSVLARTKDKNPVSDLTTEDYEWILPEQSHVETSTFYITTDTGHAVMCQIIHSKVKYFTPYFRRLMRRQKKISMLIKLSYHCLRICQRTHSLPLSTQKQLLMYISSVC